MATTGRGGDHGNEEARGEEGREEACGEEDREEEDREEVVLPVAASSDVEKGKFVLVGVGAPRVSLPAVPGVPYFIAPKGRYKVAKVSLPEGVLEEDVEVTEEWDPGEDEDMRVVHEIHEDDPVFLKVTIRRKLAATVESVVLSVDLEQE